MDLVAVVGAGPAGLMAAEHLAQAGRAVAVYDRMPSVGRKFQLAGRGGLNLTHSEPLGRFLEHYGPARPVLAPAIEAFPPDALRAWCAGLGQETFVGSSGRVFPRSFKATPLLRAWLGRLAGLGVRFHMGHRWTGWDDAGALRFAAASGEVVVRPAATVLALGGASWPRLGSDGGWVDLLRARGVMVNPFRPANCGFLHAWSPVFRARFAGEPLKRIAATFEGVTVRGEAMLTEWSTHCPTCCATPSTPRAAPPCCWTCVLTWTREPWRAAWAAMGNRWPMRCARAACRWLLPGWCGRLRLPARYPSG